MWFRELPFEAQFGELRSRLLGAQHGANLEAAFACIDGMAAHGARVDEQVIPYVRQALDAWDEQLPPLWGGWRLHEPLSVAPPERALLRGLKRGSRWLQLVRTVRLRERMTQEVLPLLAAREDMSDLRQLDLAQAHIVGEQIEALLRAPWAAHITALDLSGRKIHRSLECWADRPMERLEWLRLSRARLLGMDNIEGIRRGTPALRALALGHNRELFTGPLRDEDWSQLDALCVENGNIHYTTPAPGGWSIDRVLSGARGARLRELGMEAALLSAPGAPIEGGQALRTLDIAAGPGVMAALAHAPLSNLRDLTLELIEDDVAALAALLGSLPGLGSLTIRGSGTIPGVADALREAAPRHLHTLDLSLLTIRRDLILPALPALLTCQDALPALRSVSLPSAAYGESRALLAGTWLGALIG